MKNFVYASRKSPAERGQLIELYRRSNLTVRRFAMLHGINPGTFSQWLYNKKLKDPSRSPAFQEVIIPQPLSSAWGAEISWGEKITIRLDQQAAASFVGQWIQAAQRSC